MNNYAQYLAEKRERYESELVAERDALNLHRTLSAFCTVLMCILACFRVIYCLGFAVGAAIFFIISKEDERNIKKYEKKLETIRVEEEAYEREEKYVITDTAPKE